MGQKVIYDIGANNGDDIPYYLMKADVVVAIEANPQLCEGIEARFQAEIQSGRLILENCVAIDQGDAGLVDFYVHTSNHVLSQMQQPSPEVAAYFERFQLPAKPIVSLVNRYGDPYYVKIDIEGCDGKILKALFHAGLFPPFISAESHTIEVFALLVAMGRYNAFKLVDGSSVAQVYANRLIVDETKHCKIPYSFPYHSAGPFGNDVDGAWMTGDNFFRLLAVRGLGWKDIHATNLEAANPAAQVVIKTV
jgi:FkbM family methyltransferase